MTGLTSPEKLRSFLKLLCCNPEYVTCIAADPTGYQWINDVVAAVTKDDNTVPMSKALLDVFPATSLHLLTVSREFLSEEDAVRWGIVAEGERLAEDQRVVFRIKNPAERVRIAELLNQFIADDPDRFKWN